MLLPVTLTYITINHCQYDYNNSVKDIWLSICFLIGLMHDDKAHLPKFNFKSVLQIIKHNWLVGYWIGWQRWGSVLKLVGLVDDHCYLRYLKLLVVVFNVLSIILSHLEKILYETRYMMPKQWNQLISFSVS